MDQSHEWKMDRYVHKAVSSVTDRKHKKVNYFITQFLTAQGLFRTYLYRTGTVDRSDCISCKLELNDVHHIFACDRWKDEKQTLENVVGQISLKNVIGMMLQSERY